MSSIQSNRSKLALGGLVASAIILSLLACSGSAQKEQAADRGKLRVVTTFTIPADMASNVAGDRAIVESITKFGSEIHEYEPTPLDIVKAQSADIVLRNGLGLERWFERFMGSIRDVPSYDLSDGIQPMGIAAGPYNGRPNPHAWMSPTNALIYVDNIRAALAENDPENAEYYRANAEAYSQRIREIDAPLRELLEGIPESQRWLVSSEGAFSYLIRDYGMRELYLWPVNADEQGTPQQVQQVIDTVRAQGIPVIFSESTISNKPALQVAGETGIHYGGILFVDSLTEAAGLAPSYLDLLTYNARTIAEGFREGLAK